MHHATLFVDMPEELWRGWPAIIRRTEPDDYEALQRIFSGPRVIAGTLQLPLPSGEMWRQRLADPPEGMFSLVACADDEVVGEISLHTTPTR
jgi:putative acetyltransferase